MDREILQNQPLQLKALIWTDDVSCKLLVVHLLDDVVCGAMELMSMALETKLISTTHQLLYDYGYEMKLSEKTFF